MLVLQEQHALLSLLCERVRPASTNEERQEDFAEFSKALIAHLACLDSVLLPAVADLAQPDTSTALIEGSSDLRRCLADAVAAPDVPAFVSAMSVIADRLQEHLAVEALTLPLKSVSHS